MPSQIEWTLSNSPNYVTNLDKVYPYSEVPHIGQYKLVKLPTDTPFIQLVDYWGEGRINSESGVSGFLDCYNVNHPHQCVSNGPDRGKKIPNRVPVLSYTNCDTSAYIKDNTVRTVTLMGAPINNSCSKDIARMVNSVEGKVVVFGFNRSSADIGNLERDLSRKGFILCAYYDLPCLLKGLTLFDNLSNPLKLTSDLRNHIASEEYEAAVTLSKSIAFSSYSDILKNVATGLLESGSTNVMNYAYHLWNGDAQIVVSKYFPVEFQSIFNESPVKLTNKKNSLSLKLGNALDRDNDRRAYGDGMNSAKDRLSWILQPEWGESRVIFRLMNVDHGMFLKLVLYQDSIYDREAWGDFNCTEARSAWFLDPVYAAGELLFFIVNVEYGLGLKLAAIAGSDGDRAAWGHNSDVHGDPSYFGWYIKQWS